MTEACLNMVLMEARQVKGALKAMPIKTDPGETEGVGHSYGSGYPLEVLAKWMAKAA